MGNILDSPLPSTNKFHNNSFNNNNNKCNMKVYIKTENKKTFYILCHENIFISELKTQISNRINITEENLTLFYDDILLDDNKKLFHYDIKDDSILSYIEHKADKEIVEEGKEDNRIEVYIKSQYFQLPMRVSLSFTVRQLKMKIEKKKGIAEYQQRLSYNFFELIDENKTLEQLQIKEYSMIYLKSERIEEGFPRLLSFLLSNDLLPSSPFPPSLYLPLDIPSILSSNDHHQYEDEIKESCHHIVFTKPINRIPKEIEQLIQLQSITANRCYLSSISPFIQSLSQSLTSLHLSFNSLKFLPNEMMKLNKVTDLDLSHNKLIDIPPSISFITSLSFLNLSSNEITFIPHEIKTLSSLTYLNLSHNQIEIIPGDLFNHLTLLKSLSLKGNFIHHIPANDIGKLKEIVDIDFTDNQIYDLPFSISSFSNLSYLFELNFNNNQINSISPNIMHLTQLVKLHFDNNHLTFIPPEISYLFLLTEINVNENQMLYIPVEISALPNLRKLSMRKNNISLFPPQLCHLSTLIEVNLEENKISSLPDEIGMLLSLQILKLSCNLLSSLPPNISKLKSLRTLHIADNLFPHPLPRSHLLFQSFSSLDYFLS